MVLKNQKKNLRCSRELSATTCSQLSEPWPSKALAWVFLTWRKKTILPLAQRFQALDQKKIDEISRNGLDEKEVEEWAQSIDTFWKDEVIQQVYERGNEYNLLESAKYFIADVGARTILPRDYVPDHEHCVHSRKATEAITEYTFFDSVKKMAKITLVDVGGQRDRRKKWIRCFEHVTCILFIASLADYDMNLEEDETRNRMYESIDLFYGVRNMEWFRNTPIVLFLNKHDKFLEKIEKKELPFVDYEGGNDADKAYEYIESAFRGDPADDDMYVYKTVAVDKNNINKIWNTVRDVVTNKNMVDMGMAPPVY
mmetsp:Transcript_31392/g.60564  ORF Transcript_31392/g.60564 Transcript_31392/m.60564 type:complete len:312 (-) Transcript_31392:48-983(-)